MTYTTASGVPIPQGTDAFNPPAQFKDWADGAAEYENRVTVDLDSDRTSLAAPKLRDGIECYVRATKKTWQYQDSTWVDVSLEDTGWISPSLVNSWVDAAVGEEVQYRRMNGVVYLTGRAALGTTGTAFTLPEGFRPAAVKHYSVRHQSTTTQTLVTVNTNGTVALVSGNQPQLAAIAFPVG